MSARAVSFLARGESPAQVARRTVEAARQIGNPSGVLMFVSGELALALDDLGERLRGGLGSLPMLVATGHGVLSERGEIERESAAAALVFDGAVCDTVRADNGAGADLGVALAAALERRLGPSTTAFVFVRPRGIVPHSLEPLKALRCAALTGAGTATDQGVLALGPDGDVRPAAAGALLLRGLSRPAVRASPACRLITPLLEITAVRGPMVLEIEGSPALEVLSTAAGALSDQPLLFVVLAASGDDETDEDAMPPLLLRGIQGVDPVRQGLVISEEVRTGMRMAFAVRDAAAARSDLETLATRLYRESAGSAPRFGVYVNCAGRGSSLYGAADVDTRILRNRFPDVPIVGLNSSFEIAPHAGAPALQLYTGVLTLFTSPS